MAIETIIYDFVTTQRELLALELQAEQDEEQELVTAAAAVDNNNKNKTSEERASHILGNLEASEVSVGLYGRTVVQLSLWSASVAVAATTSTSASSTFGSNNDSSATAPDDGDDSKLRKQQQQSGSLFLPAHRFTVGDEVEIRPKGGGKGPATSSSSSSKSGSTVGGVISAVSDTFVAVALFSGGRSSHHSQQQSASKRNANSTRPQKSNSDEGGEDLETSILNLAPLTLVPKSSVEVHKKLLSALTILEKQGIDHSIAGPVIQAMFDPSGQTNVAPPSSQNPKPEPFNPNLDESQLDAIAFALQKDRPVALIHGPPGTGKTTTVAELIRQAVRYHGMKVLVTAPSNVAVDNILERLVAMDDQLATTTTKAAATRGKKGSSTSATSSSLPSLRRLRTVRLGHPARIKSSILTHSLEALVQSSEGTEIVQDVRQELQSFLKILSNPKSRGQDKRVAYREIKSLRKEVRVREERVVQELITSADVVLATTVGAANRILEKIGALDGNGGSDGSVVGFDLVIIDEAAQALETSCWIPILRGRKVVLAGDHCQLPPTIKSKNRKAVAGLSNTMFERLMKLYDNNRSDHKDKKGQQNNDRIQKSSNSRHHQISRMLQIQYRMHHSIADWASQAMYHGELLTHDSVRNRTLGQLPSVEQAHAARTKESIGSAESKNYSGVDVDDMGDTTLLLVDTAGCDMHEETTVAGSRFNEGEADIVCEHVRGLLKLGVAPEQVAVITPYNGQVELLRGRLLPDFPKLEIRSVDGFQGGEREAVILSLVRSSARGGKDGIGFLRDDRRQNVAVTRAKRHLAVICDTETVSQSPFIGNLIGWIEEHGEQRSAVEYTVETSTKGYDEAELRATEANLLKLIESSGTSSKSKQRGPVSSQGKGSPDDEVIEESRRRALMDTIAAFAVTGVQGDEMALSSELSSYDRRLVHEFAEQLGLGHESTGIDRVDRRIVLTIRSRESCQHIVPLVSVDAMSESPVDDDDDKEQSVPAVPQIGGFAALALETSDSDGSDIDESENTKAEGHPFHSTQPSIPAANSLLAQLAADRAARQQQQKSSVKSASQVGNGKKKNNNAKGQKLGGSGPQPSASQSDERCLDGLDDLAFLDAQVERAQNAHGRKVVGGGKGYRTIVNGILNAIPEPKAKPSNVRASTTLQSKLKEAEKARKAKNVKGKKK